MADSSSDADMLRLLQIQTIAVVMQMRRKKKGAQRRFYTRSIITQLTECGDYHQLVRELELGDSEYYPRYPGRYSVASWPAMMICCNLDLPEMT